MGRNSPSGTEVKVTARRPLPVTSLVSTVTVEHPELTVEHVLAYPEQRRNKRGFGGNERKEPMVSSKKGIDN